MEPSDWENCATHCDVELKLPWYAAAVVVLAATDVMSVPFALPVASFVGELTLPLWATATAARIVIVASERSRLSASQDWPCAGIR
jgi:hypothetical protein